MICKIKNIKQKKMLVEDYAQRFTQLVNRLEVAERPTPEMLAGYFLKGLRRSLRSAVASVDVAAGMEDLIEVAAKVEKRYGILKDESDSDSDSSLDLESDSDLDTFDSSNSDSDSSEDEGSTSKIKKKKKKKEKKKKKDKK